MDSDQDSELDRLYSRSHDDGDYSGYSCSARSRGSARSQSGGPVQPDSVAYEAVDLQTHSLLRMERQGIVPNLYHYLWLKSNELESAGGVRIPDTIIFVNGSPEEWFFMSKDGRRVLKKRRDRMTIPHIKAAFAKSSLNCKGSIVATMVKMQRYGGSDNEHVHETFLEREDLVGFLDMRHKPPFVILQRWLDPYFKHNTLFRVRYRGADTTMVQCRNDNVFANDELSPHERCPTFEGREVPARIVPWTIRTTTEDLFSELQQISFGMVHHVRAFSRAHVSISAMDLTFKMDSTGLLWFLYASRVDAVVPLTSREHTLRARVVRRLPQRRTDNTGGTAAPSKVMEAVARFKDMRSAVIAGKAKACNPEFVCALLRRELARLKSQLKAELVFVERAQRQVDALVFELGLERQKTERLRLMSEAVNSEGAVDVQALQWLDGLSVKPKRASLPSQQRL